MRGNKRFQSKDQSFGPANLANFVVTSSRTSGRRLKQTTRGQKLEQNWVQEDLNSSTNQGGSSMQLNSKIKQAQMPLDLKSEQEAREMFNTYMLSNRSKAPPVTTTHYQQRPSKKQRNAQQQRNLLQRHFYQRNLQPDEPWMSQSESHNFETVSPKSAYNQIQYSGHPSLNNQQQAVVSQSLAIEHMPQNMLFDADNQYMQSYNNSITPSGRAGKRLNQHPVAVSQSNQFLNTLTIEDPLNSAQQIASHLVSFPNTTTAVNQGNEAQDQTQFFNRRNNPQLSQSIDPANLHQLKQSGRAFFSPQPERQSMHVVAQPTEPFYAIKAPLVSHAIRAEKLEKEQKKYKQAAKKSKHRRKIIPAKKPRNRVAIKLEEAEDGQGTLNRVDENDSSAQQNNQLQPPQNGVISGQSNNNFQNNINNSIILLQNENKQASSTQALNLKLLQKLLDEGKQEEAQAATRMSFQQFISGQEARRQQEVTSGEDQQNSPGNESAIERQNNEMLMQILYNNLKKASQRGNRKKKKKPSYSRSRSRRFKDDQPESNRGEILDLEVNKEAFRGRNLSNDPESNYGDTSKGSAKVIGKKRLFSVPPKSSQTRVWQKEKKNRTRPRIEHTLTASLADVSSLKETKGGSNSSLSKVKMNQAKKKYPKFISPVIKSSLNKGSRSQISRISDKTPKSQMKTVTIKQPSDSSQSLKLLEVESNEKQTIKTTDAALTKEQSRKIEEASKQFKQIMKNCDLADIAQSDIADAVASLLHKQNEGIAGNMVRKSRSINFEKQRLTSNQRKISFQTLNKLAQDQISESSSASKQITSHKSFTNQQSSSVEKSSRMASMTKQQHRSSDKRQTSGPTFIANKPNRNRGDRKKFLIRGRSNSHNENYPEPLKSEQDSDQQQIVERQLRQIKERVDQSIDTVTEEAESIKFGGNEFETLLFTSLIENSEAPKKNLITTKPQKFDLQVLQTFEYVTDPTDLEEQISIQVSQTVQKAAYVAPAKFNYVKQTSLDLTQFTSINKKISQNIELDEALKLYKIDLFEDQSSKNAILSDQIRRISSIQHLKDRVNQEFRLHIRAEIREIEQTTQYIRKFSSYPKLIKIAFAKLEEQQQKDQEATEAKDPNKETLQAKFLRRMSTKNQSSAKHKSSKTIHQSSLFNTTAKKNASPIKNQMKEYEQQSLSDGNLKILMKIYELKRETQRQNANLKIINLNEKHLKKIFEIVNFEYSVKVLCKQRQKEALRNLSNLHQKKNVESVLLNSANIGLLIPRKKESNLDMHLKKSGTVGENGNLVTPSKEKRRAAFQQRTQTGVVEIKAGKLFDENQASLHKSGPHGSIELDHSPDRAILQSTGKVNGQQKASEHEFGVTLAIKQVSSDEKTAKFGHASPTTANIVSQQTLESAKKARLSIGENEIEELQDEQLSHDSSVASAILNAQNLGIDGDKVLHGRLGMRENDHSEQYLKEIGSRFEDATQILARQALMIVESDDLEELESKQMTMFKMNNYLKLQTQFEQQMKSAIKDVFVKTKTLKQSQFVTEVFKINNLGQKTPIQEAENDKDEDSFESISCSIDQQDHLQVQQLSERREQNDCVKISGSIGQPARFASSQINQIKKQETSDQSSIQSVMRKRSKSFMEVFDASLLRGVAEKFNKSPSKKKAQEEHLLQELFHDDIIPQSRIMLKKVNGYIARQLLFFSTEQMKIKNYDAIKISEVTKAIQNMGLNTKALLENYIKNNWFTATLRTKKARTKNEIVAENITATEALLKSSFDKLQNQIKFQNNQTMLNQFKSLLQKIDPCIAPKLDYEQWVLEKLNRVSHDQLLPDYHILYMNHDVFWQDNQFLVKDFLRIKRKLDEPEDILEEQEIPRDLFMIPQEVKDESRDILSNSISSATGQEQPNDKIVISAEQPVNRDNISQVTFESCNDILEKEMFVDQVQITMSHKFNMYREMCKTALEISNNSQYVIFRILSQSKVYKLKHLIKEKYSKGKGQQVETLVDRNIRMIRRLTIAQMEQFAGTQRGLRMEVCSDNQSSDAQSQSSIQQTSKYMYVELMQKRREYEENQEFIKENAQKFKSGLGHEGQTQKLIRRKSWLKEYARNIEKPYSLIDRQYPLRYGQKRLRQNYQKLAIDSSRSGSRQGKHIKALVRLLNGTSLDLNSKSHVETKLIDQCKDMTSKSVLKDYFEQIQSYYDDVIKMLKNSLYNDGFCENFERKKCMTENQINQCMNMSLHHIHEQRLEKYLRVQKWLPAFSRNVTQNQYQNYPNPFLPKEDYVSEDKSRKKYEPAGELGTKCKDFSLRFVLQSLGNSDQVTQLENQIRMNPGQSLNNYPQIYDIDDPNEEVTHRNYPIFMIFEVIHVYRKQANQQFVYKRSKANNQDLSVKPKVDQKKLLQKIGFQFSEQVEKFIKGKIKLSKTLEQKKDNYKSLYEAKKRRLSMLYSVLDISPEAAKKQFSQIKQEVQDEFERDVEQSNMTETVTSQQQATPELGQGESLKKAIPSKNYYQGVNMDLIQEADEYSEDKRNSESPRNQVHKSGNSREPFQAGGVTPVTFAQGIDPDLSFKKPVLHEQLANEPDRLSESSKSEDSDNEFGQSPNMLKDPNFMRIDGEPLAAFKKAKNKNPNIQIGDLGSPTIKPIAIENDEDQMLRTGMLIVPDSLKKKADVQIESSGSCIDPNLKRRPSNSKNMLNQRASTREIQDQMDNIIGSDQQKEDGIQQVAMAITGLSQEVFQGISANGFAGYDIKKTEFPESRSKSSNRTASKNQKSVNCPHWSEEFSESVSERSDGSGETSSIHSSQLSTPRDGKSYDSYENESQYKMGSEQESSGDDILGLGHEMLNEVQYEALVDEFEKSKQLTNKVQFNEVASVDSKVSIKTNKYEKQRRAEVERQRMSNLHKGLGIFMRAKIKKDGQQSNQIKADPSSFMGLKQMLSKKGKIQDKQEQLYIRTIIKKDKTHRDAPKKVEQAPPVDDTANVVLNTCKPCLIKGINQTSSSFRTMKTVIPKQEKNKIASGSFTPQTLQRNSTVLEKNIDIAPTKSILKKSIDKDLHRSTNKKSVASSGQSSPIVSFVDQRQRANTTVNKKRPPIKFHHAGSSILASETANNKKDVMGQGLLTSANQQLQVNYARRVPIVIGDPAAEAGSENGLQSILTGSSPKASKSPLASPNNWQNNSLIQQSDNASDSDQTNLQLQPVQVQERQRQIDKTQKSPKGIRRRLTTHYGELGSLQKLQRTHSSNAPQFFHEFLKNQQEMAEKLYQELMVEGLQEPENIAISTAGLPKTTNLGSSGAKNSSLQKTMPSPKRDMSHRKNLSTLHLPQRKWNDSGQLKLESPMNISQMSDSHSKKPAITTQQKNANAVEKREAALRMQAEELFDAIKSHQKTKIKVLLTRIGNLERRDEEGNTFLSVAVQSGQLETVQILLDKYVNIDTQNNIGNTPLHYAKSYNYMKIFRYLVMKGADETLVNHAGKNCWEGI